MSSGGHAPLRWDQALLKLTIVAALFAIMLGLEVYPRDSDGIINPVAMVTFGFIILAAFTLGEVLEKVQLPHITAYLLTGMILGPEAAHVLHVPEVLGILDKRTLYDLKLFNDLAVALIALSAGAALELDILRRGARLLASLLTAQFLALFAMLGGVSFLLSGSIPGFQLDFLASQDTSGKLAGALILAIIGSAQSPAASIAIIQETRSKGPVTEAALGVSVLNNIAVVVFFVVGFAVASSLMGESTGSGSLMGELALKIGGAAALGAVLGVGIAGYIRYVGQELLLVLTGLCFAITYLARDLGVDPLLAFLFAGFLVSNFSKAGEPLKQAIDILAMPTYVLFFFLAGANLHLHDLQEMFGYALLLFAARWFALWAGTVAGNKVGRGPKVLSRSGWLGFGAQAGIALAMAEAVSGSLGELGPKIGTLAVAGIALNEMLGPVMLKVALGWAGEHGAAVEEQPDEETHEVSGPAMAPPGWLEESIAELTVEWGEPPVLHSEELAEVSLQVRDQLQGLATDLREGVVAQRQAEQQHALGRLRREFIRLHRQALIAVNRGGQAPEAFHQELRTLPGRLALRWGKAVQARTHRLDFQSEAEGLVDLVQVLDRAALSVPHSLRVHYAAELLQPLEGDSPGRRLRKAALRLRRQWGLGPSLRVVELQDITRFTLGGETPVQLQDLAGVVVYTERALLAQVRHLFRAYADDVDELVRRRSVSDASPAEMLERLRTDMEAELQKATRSTEHVFEELARATEGVLANTWHRMNDRLLAAGTPSLSAADTRFSKVYNARIRAIEATRQRLDSGPALIRVEATQLGLELQLVRLASAVMVQAEDRAAAIGQDLSRQLVQPVRRVRADLDAALREMHVLMDDGTPSAPEVRAALRQRFDPLQADLDRALADLGQLRTNLRSQASIDPLRQGVMRGVEDLSDRVVVAVEIPPITERRLPDTLVTRELDFRGLAAQYLEIGISRDVTLLLDELLEDVDRAVPVLEELRRRVAFNTELILAELEILPQGSLATTGRELVREMLLDALEPMHSRMVGLAEGERIEQAGRALHQRVSAHLTSFAGLVHSGRWDRLRQSVVRGRVQRSRRLLAGGAGGFGTLWGDMGDAAHRALGDRSWAMLRELIGLPAELDGAEKGRDLYQVPRPRVELPVVFHRLFSDAALEAGDLLTGRERELREVRRLLQDAEPGRSRAVAVVGVGGLGQGAVVDTLLRGFDDSVRVVRHVLTERVRSAEQVDEMLAEVEENCVVVVEGLQWLFTIEPGGFAPLRHFLQRVVQDRGRNAWLIAAERPVWGYADRVVALHDAFPERVHLEPFDAEELRRAVLDRHSMSGYGLRFAKPARGMGLRMLRRSRTQGDELYERMFFESLHQATGGILSDALRLWMASVVEISDERNEVVIGDLPPTPLPQLRGLPEDVIVTLRQVARQGRITASGHASQFRLEEETSEAMLARLTHWGLLCRDASGAYVFSPALGGPIYRVLRERRIVG